MSAYSNLRHHIAFFICFTYPNVSLLFNSILLIYLRVFASFSGNITSGFLGSSSFSSILWVSCFFPSFLWCCKIFCWWYQTPIWHFCNYSWFCVWGLFFLSHLRVWWAESGEVVASWWPIWLLCMVALGNSRFEGLIIVGCAFLQNLDSCAWSRGWIWLLLRISLYYTFTIFIRNLFTFSNRSFFSPRARSRIFESSGAIIFLIN